MDVIECGCTVNLRLVEGQDKVEGYNLYLGRKVLLSQTLDVAESGTQTDLSLLLGRIPSSVSAVHML